TSKSSTRQRPTTKLCSKSTKKRSLMPREIDCRSRSSFRDTRSSNRDSKVCKRNVLGVLIDAIDLDATEEAVIAAARDRCSLTVSALAVHGLMTGVLDRQQKFRLNQFDLLVPDGQPVRWAVNWLHGASLSQRVYGPNLTLR